MKQKRRHYKKETYSLPPEQITAEEDDGDAFWGEPILVHIHTNRSHTRDLNDYMKLRRR